MVDRTVVARLLFTAPRIVGRLRGMTLCARQARKDVITIPVEQLEALTTDYDLMHQALSEMRDRLRTRDVA